MIEPVRIPSPVPISDLLKVRYASGRLTLPLSQPYFVRFEHVSGVPGAADGGGYSVFKLRILDTLIDRLTTLQGKALEGDASPGPSGGALDARIADLEKQLHDRLAKASATPFGGAMGAGAGENGRILDILV